MKSSNATKKKNKQPKPGKSSQVKVKKNTAIQPGVSKSGRPVVHLSPCAVDYARCLINPFTGPLACVPTVPSLDSRKERVFARGTFGASATGFAYVVFDPRESIVNDRDCGYYSLAGGGAVDIQTQSLAGISANFRSNSDYQTAQIGENSLLADYRVVGSGLRIRYVGTELQRGGTVVGLCEPTHCSLVGQTQTTMLAYDESAIFDATRNWSNVVYRPFLDDDFDFIGTFPVKANLDSDTCFFLGFTISGTVSGNSWDFEAYTVSELNGVNIRGMTYSHADPQAFGAIMSGPMQKEIMKPFGGEARAKEAGFLDKLGNLMLDGLSWVGSEVLAPTVKRGMTMLPF